MGVHVRPESVFALGRNMQGASHWYDLQRGQFIQGLVAKVGNERRVYVVTLEPELEMVEIHSRWPRVVQQGEMSISAYD